MDRETSPAFFATTELDTRNELDEPSPEPREDDPLTEFLNSGYINNAIDKEQLLSAMNQYINNIRRYYTSYAGLNFSDEQICNAKPSFALAQRLHVELDQNKILAKDLASLIYQKRNDLDMELTSSLQQALETAGIPEPIYQPLFIKSVAPEPSEICCCRVS